MGNGCLPTAMEAEMAIARAARQEQVGQTNKECIPKSEAIIKKARGDGACLFYSLVGENNRVRAQLLRMHVAQFVEQNLNRHLGGSSTTVKEALAQRGWLPGAYIQSIMLPSTYGGELELFFISQMQQRQLRVFMEQGQYFREVAHYGSAGELTRLLYRPRTAEAKPHYDTIQMKERWAVQVAQQQAEEQHKKQNAEETERVSVKSTEQNRKERLEERAKNYIERAKEIRKARTQESRDRPALEPVEDEEQATPRLLLEVAETGAQLYCVCQRPYSAREYYIQCTSCLGWFHPRCLEQTRVECEAKRQAGGWVCGRENCGQVEQGKPRGEEKEKEE